jgi:alkanesulfonate monooxygenase SsuD/methylene tetrahydromethanopterin reductase-like flavin-dependent oxidoreductase (luciferase family)
MRVGVCIFPQNYGDWGRFESQEKGDDVPGVPEVADVGILEEHLALGRLVEPLGFDSIWTAEHHVTPYLLVPNPLSLLTYFAACTERIDVGTMVVVLPWHHPVRVAEDMVMLQTMLGPDRRAIVGLGRGAGRREFGALGVSMNDSREMFKESVEIIRLAIGTDRFEFHGNHYDIAEMSLRPTAPNRQLLDDLHCAWGTPSSAPMAAELGLKPLIIPQKAWKEYDAELAEFANIRDAGGHHPVQPKIAVWIYCAENEEDARRGAERNLPEYQDSANRHYELGGSHFADLKGYEHYAKYAETLGVGGGQHLGDVWLDNHVWGTPQQCIDRIAAINAHMGPDELIIVPRYASITAEEAERSMRLFASDVLPSVKAMDNVVVASR